MVGDRTAPAQETRQAYDHHFAYHGRWGILLRPRATHPPHYGGRTDPPLWAFLAFVLLICAGALHFSEARDKLVPYIPAQNARGEIRPIVGTFPFSCMHLRENGGLLVSAFDGVGLFFYAFITMPLNIFISIWNAYCACFALGAYYSLPDAVSNLPIQAPLLSTSFLWWTNSIANVPLAFWEIIEICIWNPDPHISIGEILSYRTPVEHLPTGQHASPSVVETGKHPRTPTPPHPLANVTDM
jgi:hypothetical protein